MILKLCPPQTTSSIQVPAPKGSITENSTTSHGSRSQHMGFVGDTSHPTIAGFVTQSDMAVQGKGAVDVVAMAEHLSLSTRATFHMAFLHGLVVLPHSAAETG